MSNEPTRVVHLTFTKDEFVAFVAAANLGVFFVFSPEDDIITHEAGRSLFKNTQAAMYRVGDKAWSNFLDQVKRVGNAAFPELKETEGEFTGRVPRKRT